MTVKMNGIRAVLAPLLFISYVFGTRIIEFPAGEPKPLCSFLYIFLVWSIYFYLFMYTIIYYMMDTIDSNESSYIMQLCFWLNTSIALLSILIATCHDKKYRNCLRHLNIVENTLEKIGIITDYEKLYTEMLLTIFGWLIYIICTISINTLWNRENYSASYSFYISFMFDYPSHVHILDDLLIISILRYIELKYEQINEYIRKLDGNSDCEIKLTWEHSALLRCQIGYLKSMSSEYATWVVIHLHLELYKISRELNSMFELQMTIKMGVYFFLMAVSCQGIFEILFITKLYQNRKKTLSIIMTVIFLILNIFRLFIINYMCEKVSVKANATRDVINRIPYSIFDVVVRENISQFLLQMSLTPLKFYGLGLFNFGLKFFYGFSNSVSTVVVILIQSYVH